MHKRAEPLAHMQNTNSQYNLPAIQTKLAYKSHRAEVAQQLPAPAVHKRIEVDRALINTDARLLTGLALDLVQTAKAHAAQTFDRLRSIPGLGKIVALGLLDEIHDIHRFPRVQEFVSYGRLVKGAHESAGKRSGTSDTKIGTAYLTWAFSEAAVRCWRNNPAGQKSLARTEKQHGKRKTEQGWPIHWLVPSIIC